MFRPSLSPGDAPPAHPARLGVSIVRRAKQEFLAPRRNRSVRSEKRVLFLFLAHFFLSTVVMTVEAAAAEGLSRRGRSRLSEMRRRRRDNAEGVDPSSSGTGTASSSSDSDTPGSTSPSDEEEGGGGGGGKMPRHLHHHRRPGGSSGRERLERSLAVDRSGDERVVEFEGERSRLTELSLHLYSEILKSEHGPAISSSNFVFSPYAIIRMLLALRQGAAGRTYEELSRVLAEEEEEEVLRFTALPECLQGFEDDQDSGHDNEGNEDSSGGGGGGALRLAERIYVGSHDRDERLKAYQQEQDRLLGISVHTCEFVSRRNAAKEMNAFVRRRTGSLIQRVVSASDLPLHHVPDIAITHAALLRKAQWRVAFDSFSQGIFHALTVGPDGAPEEVVQPGVLFMQAKVDKRSRSGFEVLSGGSIQLVRIPFKDKRLGMFVVMPTDYAFPVFQEELMGFGGTLIDDMLEYTSLQQRRGRRHATFGKLHIKLPPFSIFPTGNSGTDMLSAIDSSLHLPHPITQPSDFARLSEQGGRFRVELWRHSARVDVNEKGIMAPAEAYDAGDDDSDSERDYVGSSRRAGSSSASFEAGDEDLSPAGSSRFDEFFIFNRPFYFQVRYQPNYDRPRVSTSDDLILFAGHVVDAFSAQQV